MRKLKKYRSQCPQYLALDVFGDKWSLLIIRDMILEDKRHFREFLQSEERIASNILTNRLQALEAEGIIHKENDPNHKQKLIYSLTQKGIDLFPIIMEIARWSLRYKPVDEERAKRAKQVLNGGKEVQSAIMTELAAKHIKR